MLTTQMCFTNLLAIFESFSVYASKGKGIRGNAIIDNLGFFETGFSPYEIKALYQNGLHNFMEVMPVSPRNRLATTWGEIESR